MNVNQLRELLKDLPGDVPVGLSFWTRSMLTNRRTRLMCVQAVLAILFTIAMLAGIEAIEKIGAEIRRCAIAV